MHIEQTLMKLNISFLIKDDEFLKEYNEIWRNVRNNIKKEYHSESVYNEKDVTCKTKPFNGRINTNTKRSFSIYLLIRNFDRFCF